MSYRLDANGNLVQVDPFAAWNTPVSTMDQVSQLSSSGNWLAPAGGTPGVPGMPANAPAGFGGAGFGTPAAAGGFLGGLGKIGGWLGKNGAAIGQWGNLASQGIQAYVGLQQLGLAKDALKFEKKAFKTNLANQVDSYNTQMKDRTTGRWYATEEERQAALKEAELPQGMRG
jgi:hypothetical protein